MECERLHVNVTRRIIGRGRSMCLPAWRYSTSYHAWEGVGYHIPKNIHKPRRYCGRPHRGAPTWASELHSGLLRSFSWSMNDLCESSSGAWGSQGEATNFVLRRSDEVLRSHCESKRSRCDVVRCGLITEVQARSGLEKSAETREFYTADYFSGSEVSAEPVVFSRATRLLDVRKGRFCRLVDS